MRSLISILELTVEELDQLIATAKDIIAHPENYWASAATRSWLPCSLSPPPVPA